MEIIKAFNLYCILILAWLLSSACVPTEKQSTDNKEKKDVKLEDATKDERINKEDSRIEYIDVYSLVEAISYDWGFDIRIVPTGKNEDINLGVIVRTDKSWVGSYGGGFASCELKKIVDLNENTVRFYVDIWRNADPERPFAPRQDNTPVYSFYVDLSATIFREAVLRGINEKRQVVVIKLPAFDTSGNPVGEWYRK